MSCTTYGLRECRGCKYRKNKKYDYDSAYGRCWMDVDRRKINASSDDLIKKKFLEYIRPNKHGYYDPDWAYYYINTLIILFPERKHIIEKLLVLA